MYGEVRLHRFDDAGSDRGGGVVIEVNATHCQFLKNSGISCEQSELPESERRLATLCFHFIRVPRQAECWAQKLPGMRGRTGRNLLRCTDCDDFAARLAPLGA